MMYDSFQELKGKIITGICLTETALNDDVILFQDSEQNWYVYELDGECCSESWVQHMSGVSNLLYHEILETDLIFMAEVEQKTEAFEHNDHLKVYGYKIKTTEGSFDMEFRNASNGYYGVVIREHALKTWPEIQLAFSLDKNNRVKLITEDF